MGLKTIKEGEQALVLNNRGQARIVIGPRVVRDSYKFSVLYSYSYIV